jgi:hemerythrin-like metal-binding protein
MSLIEWRKEFETGIPDVDHEHRELVDIINRLHEHITSGADRSHITKFLGEVFAKIAAHFALEESIMRKHAYDEYEAHKAEHERLLDEIRDIMDAQRDNPSSAYGDSLSSTVRDWFVNHFKSKDARLHKKLGV